MKGIVVEINQKDAVVLTEGGLFTKIKNEKYTLGQTIDTRKSISFGAKWVAGAVSMAAVLAVSTIGAFAYYTPTDYVSMDVNPSVEYTINMFDRILDVKAVNDDGKEMIANLDLKNMNIEDALKETLDQLIEDGYLTDDPDGGVVITTSNEEQGDAEQLAKDIKKEIQNYLGSRKGINAVVDAKAVKPEKVEEAKDLGVTPGKLTLVEKLKDSTSGAISMDEWLNKPVREINKAIKNNRKYERANQEVQVQQDDAADSETDRDNSDGRYQGKWQREDSGDRGDNQYFTSNGGIDLDDLQNWNGDRDYNSSGNDGNNGQGNGDVKDWFNNGHESGGNGWGSEWTSSGGVEPPGNGKHPDRHTDSKNQSNDEGWSDETD